MVLVVCSLWFMLVLWFCVYLMIWWVFGRFGDMIIWFFRILVGWKDVNVSYVFLIMDKKDLNYINRMLICVMYIFSFLS